MPFTALVFVPAFLLLVVSLGIAFMLRRSNIIYMISGSAFNRDPERVKMARIVDHPVVRLGLAALLAFKVLDDFFATALTIAYRINLTDAAENLGQLTAGDDYKRLIPLMEGVPLWLHGLWVLAGVLYLVAIVRVLRGSGKAHLPVLAAICVEIAAEFASRPIIDAIGVRANPNPSLFAAVIIPFVLPLLLALVLSRQTSPPTAAPSKPL